jgi:uncharacterized protein YqeY
MDLRKKLEADMVASMKAKDKIRLSVIRMVRSEIKNQEIQKGEALKESDTLSLLSRSAKQRRESIVQFQTGGREDLVRKETQELEIILEYLPTQLTSDEVREIIQKTIEETGATSAKEMGAVMGRVMAEVSGKADGKEVQRMVLKFLS